MKLATVLAGASLTTALALSVVHGRAEPQAPPPAAPKPITFADALAWKSLQGATLSPDGQWFSYRIAPAEGEGGELILRRTKNAEEKRIPAGRGGSFSDDSKWMTYTVVPGGRGGAGRQGGGGGGGRRGGKAGDAPAAAQGRVVVMELATGNKQEFDRMRRAAFSPEGTGWIAMHRQPEAATGGDTGTGRGTGSTTGIGTGTATVERATGSDLILRELVTGQELNIGNVSEFTFDKKGQWLVVVIDAAGQAGNGVQLRHLASGTQVPLDGGKASYRGLTLSEDGEALSVLKGVDDPAYEGKRYSVLGFTNLAAKPVRKVVYDPQSDPNFPAGMTVSPNRTPTWTDDREALVFGIHELTKRTTPATTPTRGGRAGGAMNDDGDDFAYQPPRQAQPRGRGPAPEPTTQRQGGPANPDKPDLVIWHWQDSRLQSQQQAQEAADRNFNYLCLYRIQEGKFLRLADEGVRSVSLAPKQRWAIGSDTKPYELVASLEGKRFQDIYVIDVKTGERRQAFKKHRSTLTPSPTGTHTVYYDDGQYYSYDLATGRTVNLTGAAATRFVNEDDDHNVANPPTPLVGWAKDGQSVLISDGWDVWQFPVHGGSANNLTGDGKREGLRYRRRIALDPQERGVDLSKPMYFSVYGEWTKKAGFAVVESGSGCRKLLWDDAEFATLTKAKDSDIYLYTRETSKDATEYYATDASLASGSKLTDIGAQQSQFAWSAGSRLIEYTGTNGKKLQGALYLPANCEPGKRYPTIVYIYEKRSQGLNHYEAPRATNFSRSLYTSNGYAVLEPDITYKLNDPGRSAVWCVLPALEAAIATGVVDRDRVGLHGHSWGGYQTAFLVTQSDAFRAAIAGAPLTNMISMYSSIYWNTGGANQPIFESSQGRFTAGYWDEPEAYTRNSPVYYAKNVKTPLLILHNDHDGAVDWNQGIEYFNTLRRLGKPVVMLQYKGENHGLARPVNQKDYTQRMREFFDHHLTGKPAPDWWTAGVPHLKMDDHLKQRVEDKSKAGG